MKTDCNIPRNIIKIDKYFLSATISKTKQGKKKKKKKTPTKYRSKNDCVKVDLIIIILYFAHTFIFLFFNNNNKNLKVNFYCLMFISQRYTENIILLYTVKRN